MIYYANGCSYTWGGELFNFYYAEYDIWLPAHPNHSLNKKRLETVYPHHLGKLLNADKVINESLGCASNYRIVRTTLNYFYNLLLNGQDIKNHFVTVQWSDPSRYEVYDDSEKAYVMYTNQSVSPDSKYINAKMHSNIKDYYYKNINSLEQDLNVFFSQVNSLGNFFKTNQIPYVFFPHSGWQWSWFYNNTIEQEKYVKLMKNFNWLKNDPLYAMQTSGISTVKGSHPNEIGHQQWAQIVYDYVALEKKII